VKALIDNRTERWIDRSVDNLALETVAWTNYSVTPHDRSVNSVTARRRRTARCSLWVAFTLTAGGFTRLPMLPSDVYLRLYQKQTISVNSFSKSWKWPLNLSCM